MKRRLGALLAVVAITLGTSACMQVHEQVLDTSETQTQLQLRQAQTRTFETNDKERTLRSVIATLQDLGFVIDKADLTLGTVSATKLDGYAMRMTVSVRSKGDFRMVVRANAQMNTTAITAPAPYRSFFIALERSMFLSANSVD
jgi:hypothetical protein